MGNLYGTKYLAQAPARPGVTFIGTIIMLAEEIRCNPSTADSKNISDVLLTISEIFVRTDFLIITPFRDDWKYITK